MRVEVRECDSIFHLELVAENITDACFIARLGLNKTKQLKHCGSYFSATEASASIDIGKKQNASGDL